MARTSIYDRLSEKRLAAQALAKKEAEEAVHAAPLVVEPEPVPVLPLDTAKNAVTLAGLNLVFPSGFSFRDIDTSLEKNGQPVTLSIKRRPAPEGLTLARAFELFVENLRKQHPDVLMVRQRDCLMAGSPAIALDYHFKAGIESRHGRATGAIVPLKNSTQRQWLSISSVINPNHEALAEWLFEFDDMLDSLAID